VKELSPGIMVFDNVFLDSNKYIDKIKDNPDLWKSASLLSTNNKHKTLDNTQIRDTDIIPLPHHEKLETNVLSDLSKRFYESTKESLNSYISYYDAAIQKFEPPQLLKYGVGQNFNNHIDDHPFLTRRISMTYYLNNDYEGGDIEFSRFNLRFKAQKNQLLVFPSNFVYNHKIHPVTSGSRYVIVQWIS
jgi:hypothetical protein